MAGKLTGSCRRCAAESHKISGIYHLRGFIMRLRCYCDATATKIKRGHSFSARSYEVAANHNAGIGMSVHGYLVVDQLS